MSFHLCRFLQKFIFSVLLLCLLASYALAQMVIDQTTFHESNCQFPALATSPDGLVMLAYAASGGALSDSRIETQMMQASRTDAYLPEEPVVIAQGTNPKICWSESGFHLAIVRNDSILVYHSDASGFWNVAEFETFAAGGPVRDLDILGVPEFTTGDDVFLSVDVQPNEVSENLLVKYASHSATGWSLLESLDLVPSMTYSQLALDAGSSFPTAKLFFLGGEEEGVLNLMQSVFDIDSGWSVPALVYNNSGMPSPIMNKFDVATDLSGGIYLLGLGPQPTCPCGSIHLHSFHPVVQEWTAQNMTANHAHYDWPKSPNIVATETGRQYAFWSQLATNHDFTPLKKTLEYWVKVNGEWVYAGDFLNDYYHGRPIGTQVALSIDPYENPVLAWTQLDSINGQPQPEQVWVARRMGTASEPQPGIPIPLLNVSVWPNPFNPQTTIFFSLEEPQLVKLDVYDARGRRVVTLLDRYAEAGPTETVWNGRNSSGRSVSSGVYFVRLGIKGETRVKKVVLAE